MAADNPSSSIPRLSLAALPRDAFAGMIAGLISIAYAVSFSALIFAGPIEAGLQLGFSALMTGAAVTGLVVGLLTKLVPADAGPDTPAVAVMSVLAAAVAAAMPAGASTEQMVFHALVALSFVTLLAGLLLFALGAFKVGIWLRFIPYPVIGGFLAASGFLLVTGGLEVVLQTSDLWGMLADIATSGRIAQLLTGLALAGAILAIRRYSNSYLVLPAAFVTAIVLVNVGLVAMASFDPSADRSGWFLTGNATAQLWLPLTAIPGAEVQWPALFAQGIEMAVVCAVTAVALLLDVSSLEVARGRATDLDHELRANGIANIVAAPLGGVAGNLSMSGSVLIGEAGGVTRMATFAAAAVCAAGLFFGPTLLSIIPTPVLGGMLVYLGVSIIHSALIKTAARRSLIENVLAVGIAAAIAVFGYFIGILLGILGACMSFALSYSQISIIRQHLTRANFQGSMDRSPEQTRALAEHGNAIQILWLRGYIFFGTSNSLFEFVRRQVWAGEGGQDVSFVILDFQQVPGFDSSAVFSLVKLRNAAAEHGTTLVLSGLSEPMHRALGSAEFFTGESAGAVKAFAQRDEALLWCEDALLRRLGVGEAKDGEFHTWFAALLGSKRDAEQVIARLKRIEVAPGSTVVEQGGVSNSIDVIASGKVAIALVDAAGRSTRLKQMVGQTVVGEMGFFRKAKRAASVIAEEPTVVYRMERKAFNALAREHPAAAAAFQTALIRLLSDRLDFANREIAALQEPAPKS